MRCSRTVGKLNLDGKKVFKEVAGETFYLVKVCIGDKVEYPAVISEHLLETNMSLIEMEFYLRCEKINEKGFTFLNITSAESIRDREIENKVSIYGFVTKISKIKTIGNSGENVIHLTIKYRSHDKNNNYVHCQARGALARKLSKISKSDAILFNGYLTLENSITVHVTEVLESKPAYVTN